MLFCTVHVMFFMDIKLNKVLGTDEKWPMQLSNLTRFFDLLDEAGQNVAVIDDSQVSLTALTSELSRFPVFLQHGQKLVATSCDGFVRWGAHACLQICKREISVSH